MTRAERNKRASLPVRRNIVTRVSTVGTDPSRRAETPVSVTGPGSRKGKIRYGGSMTDGYRSAWNESPYYRTMATVDVRWSA